MLKLRKGDTAKILAGKDRGRSGKIIFVSAKSGLATVEGRNIYVRHQRSKKAGQKGQRIEVSKPLPISKLMLICPHCRKAARIGKAVNEKGIKLRICKNCKKTIS